MYLMDTDVVSELRKGDNANAGVRAFVAAAEDTHRQLYISATTVGELRRGVEMLRHRRDMRQARALDRWLDLVLSEYSEHILDFGEHEAQVWGRLRVPHPENAIDKQVAATALVRGLTLVTRNVKHFESIGVVVLNPFELE